MSYTKEYSATQGAWVLVIDGQATGFVQLKDAGPVLVAVAASAPALDSVDALQLAVESVTAISFSSLDVLDKVYVRSLHDETNRVSAFSAGTAP